MTAAVLILGLAGCAANCCHKTRMMNQASRLLKRIAKEPVALEVGATPRKNGPTPLDDGETLYKLPESWAWERLSNAVEVLDSLRKPVTKSDRKPGPYPYYGASGVVDYVSDFLFDEDLVLVGEDGTKWCAGDRDRIFHLRENMGEQPCSCVATKPKGANR